MLKCKFCNSERFVKNGFIGDKQRYGCKCCKKTMIQGDEREKYTNDQRKLAITMYLNNCGFRMIERILGISNVLVLHWVKKCARIVKEIIENREQKSEEIPVLEMDELYTYIKKNK